MRYNLNRFRDLSNVILKKTVFVCGVCALVRTRGYTFHLV